MTRPTPHPLNLLPALRPRSASLVPLAAALMPLAGAAQSPNWADDIAPVLYEQCVSCHHEGGSGPFALVTPEHARARIDRIIRALRTGHMPPWLPDADGPAMTGERRLTQPQIAAFDAWRAAGMPSGDVARAPQPPVTADGWSLGEPDLVVEFPAYDAPAEGFDVYRNLVVSPQISAPVWVRAVDLQPGNARVVHHARFMVDTTASSRERDALEEGTGFDGMHLGTRAASPEGFFVGWTPGRVADPGRDDLAWRLEPGTDLVLQVHLRPTGAAERVQPRIGLYLAAEPPREMPVVIMLENKALDIPAGDEARVAEERFRTPVDLEALTIYPHAHYIGRRIRSWAELPDGGRRELLSISEWDFNWQDQYRYAEPVAIPAGSEIVMEWTFDNSAANPRNPNDPPQRVVFGPQSTDEMAELNIQVLPRDPDDRPALVQALGDLYRAADAAFMVRSARERGDEMARAGLWLDALEAYRAALREADDPEILQRMAAVIVAMGDAHGGVIVAERAALRAPQSARALLTLARAYALAQRSDAARDAAERAIEAAQREGLDAVADSARAVLRRPR